MNTNTGQAVSLHGKKLIWSISLIIYYHIYCAVHDPCLHPALTVCVFIRKGLALAEMVNKSICMLLDS